MSIGGYNRRVEKFTDWALLVVGIVGGILMGIVVVDLGVPDAPRLTALTVFLFVVSVFSLFRILKRRREQQRKHRRHSRTQPLPRYEVPTKEIEPPRRRSRRH